MRAKEEGSGFKLLAIRPLKGCDSKFLRSLKEDQLYQFYNNYKFIFGKNNEIIEVNEDKVNYDLYSIPRGDVAPLRISISAIVGKNGSGKSSLIDLFFGAIYNFSLNRDFLDIDESPTGTSQLIQNLNVQIIYEFDKNIFILDTSSMSDDKGGAKENLEISILKTEVNFSDSMVLRRSFKLDNILNKDEDEKSEWLLKYFFYSVAVNYSIYGLNNLHIGSWINPLFHKNDGYKAPLVINPMRHEGNFDINRELFLSKSRLISNILHPDYIIKQDTLKLTDFQKVSRVSYSLNKKQISDDIYVTPSGLHVKLFDFYNWHGGKESFLARISNTFFNGKLNSLLKKVKYSEVALNYIIRKLFKIASIYEGYEGFLKGDYPSESNYEGAKIHDYSSFLRFHKIEDYLKLIYTDNSHITFKLRQAINYIGKLPLIRYTQK